MEIHVPKNAMLWLNVGHDARIDGRVWLLPRLPVLIWR